ncbi:MAG: Pleiotropic regulatory protein [Desulfatitalea sp. BRH_c12]|nr:MAG: Pleiotropic regulatory protein [Desulfatitalea sp. BRH_c12]
MKVALLDLKAQYQTIREEIRACIDEICDSQMFILGPQVEQMEADIARYCQTGHAVGVSSGSDALIIALMAVGIGPGDRVITTPYTFFATAGAIARVGAVPVFVDIDPATYNLDPERLAACLDDMDAAARATVKAVIPVHLYGQCADMDPILDVCRRYGLVVVEDAAQAIGAEYKGRRAGSMGDFGCFSFFPSKNLGAFGDGGVVTTRSPEYDRQLRLLRMHGMAPKYYHQVIGGNFRLDALQAAIVKIKLAYLDDWTRARQHNAATYRRMFADAGLAERIQAPAEVHTRHIYNQFIIRVAEGRDALRDYLGQKEIGCDIYYPVPLHRQACFAYLDYRPGDFPESERAAEQTLALPIYPELPADQLAYVVACIQEFVRKQ